jgi:mRNA turnover protein 4
MEHKKKMVEDIRACLDEYKYVYLFSVGDMRADGLQEVRKLWKGTGRIIYGKNKVVAKALGESEETEYKTGLSEIAKVSLDETCLPTPLHVPIANHSRLHLHVTQRLKGPLGLFLTSWEPTETIEWFSTFSRPTYARQNFPATQTLVLPVGPVKNFEDEVFPHSMEPQLRGCGLMTSLEKGVPVLKVETTVCKKGEKLTGEKARLLLILGYMQAVSRVSCTFFPLVWFTENCRLVIRTDVPSQTRFQMVGRGRLCSG